MSSVNTSCPTREVKDTDAITAAEGEMAAWYRAQKGAPGVEVHDDVDATWLVHTGAVWGNCVVNVRFRADAAQARLDTILRSFRATKRGVGFWISPFATPAELARLLNARGLRCRKHFPVMFCDLGALPPTHSRNDLTVSVLDDHSVFERHPHPYFGDIRTPLRRFELARLAYLNQKRPRQVWDFVAWRDGTPVSGCTLFKHGTVIGFHDVGTLGAYRRQGIGTGLMQHACSFAREHGCKSAVLIASGEGHGMYKRAGFHDVGPISYWYRSFRPASKV
jgi:GNAT superfamily N-acetyltransferase